MTACQVYKYRFYRAFEATLLPVVLRVRSVAFRIVGKQAPLTDLQHGVICLSRKAVVQAEELTRYRPITLLNCDDELIMLVVSTRLQRPLDYIFAIFLSHCQLSCVAGISATTSGTI